MSAFVMNQWIIRPHKTYVSQSTMLFDVVAVSIATDKSYLPAFYNRGRAVFTVAELRAVFHPHEESGLLWKDWGGRSGRIPGMLFNPSEFKDLVRAWMTVIRVEPIAYLRHRWTVFKAVLGIAPQSVWPFWMDYADLTPSPTLTYNLRKSLVDRMNQTHQSLMFRSWFYLSGIMGIVLLGIIGGVQHKPAYLAILSSVLLFQMSYFIVAPSHTFRYSIWGMGAFFLLIPLLRIPHSFVKLICAPRQMLLCRFLKSPEK